MSEPVQLIPMFCVRCQAPVPAQPGEIAWVCAQCGQSMMLSDEKGVTVYPFHYSAGIAQDKKGWPFWVANGLVNISGRETYSGNESGAMQAFWQESKRFFVPAFAMNLEQLVEIGTRMLIQPPVLEEGSPASFNPVTIMAEDMHALAEFIVLGVEAGRGDDLKRLFYEIKLDPPELWILP